MSKSPLGKPPDPPPAVPALVAPQAAPEWSDRRILVLATLVTLIVSIIWRLPEEIDYFGKHAGEIILTFVIAIGLTYLLRPAVDAIHKMPLFRGNTSEKRLRGRSLAVIVVFALCGLAVYLLVLIGLKPVSQDAVAMWNQFVPNNPQERADFFFRVRDSINKAIQPYMSLMGTDFADKLQEKLPTVVEGGVEWAKENIGRLFHGAGFIVELLLLPVLVFYFLCDGPAIRSEAKLLLPREWRPRCARMANHLDRIFDGYVRGQVVMCIIAWILVTVMLLVIRVPHAFILGLIAGLTRAIPIIGPLLGAVPLMLVCFLTTKSVPTTSLLLFGFTMMHFLESKILLPRIIGHEVDLHPVTVILALLIGMEFFGFLGVFLAVPIAAIIKIVLAEWHDGRMLAAHAVELQNPGQDAAAESPVEPLSEQSHG